MTENKQPKEEKIIKAAKSPEPLVIANKFPGYCQIILNRPKHLNTLSFPLTRELFVQLRACEESEDIKLVVLKGAGRAFCAGGDIKGLLTYAVEGNEEQVAEFKDTVVLLHELYYFMGCMKTPIITIMDGITMGACVGFAELSAFKVATENTVLAMPEGLIGHFCDASNSFTFARLEGQLGPYLALTGHKLMAEDVLFAGLATHFMNSGNVEALEERLSKLEDFSLDSIDLAVQEFSAGQDHLPSNYTLFGEKLEFIERCFRFTTVEEIVQALEKEEGSKFAKQCLKSISTQSPRSLKISLEVIRQGATGTLSDCLRNEYRVWLTLLFTHDYEEGAKSLLVYKRKPQWDPPTLEDLDLDFDIRDNFINNRNIEPPSFDPKTDYATSPYFKFLLPTGYEISSIQYLYSMQSYKETRAWFLRDRKGKFGVTQKVEDILYRRKRLSSGQSSL